MQSGLTSCLNVRVELSNLHNAEQPTIISYNCVITWCARENSIILCKKKPSYPAAIMLIARTTISCCTFVLILLFCFVVFIVRSILILWFRCAHRRRIGAWVHTKF